MSDSDNEKAGGGANDDDDDYNNDAVPMPIHIPVPIPPPGFPATLWERGAKAGWGGDAAKVEEEVVLSLSSDVDVYRGDNVKVIILIKASKLRGAAAA